MADFIDRLKHIYRTGNVLTRLIFINAFVFVVLKVIGVVFTLFNVYALDLITFLGVPSHIPLLLNRLWTPITYMFVHEGFLHLLFNMLWLWFGEYLSNIFVRRWEPIRAGGLAEHSLRDCLQHHSLYTEMGRGWMIGASARCGT